MTAPGRLEEAYAGCEAITREQAANFYYGIRLLSGERRRAMCAVYAFARRIDDIGDGALPAERKLGLLAEQERALAVLGGPPGADVPDGADFVIVALADSRTRFPLPVEALAELIEGVRMDVRGTSYASFEELVPYCRRVAGTIGRLCLAIFGLRQARTPESEARASALADDLGVALQLTNILRDIREDAENGRIYLPAEDLAARGLPGADPAALAVTIRAAAAGDEAPREALCSVISFEAGRAREWFDRGLELAGMLDRRSAACLLAMAGIYRRLLERIDADPAAVLDGRVSLPAREKALVAVRGMLGVAA
ncbi:MAG TPA: squalene/phytoene synthase family protein [Solirubrobacteraceae bacterium]|jgi:phytoene synthase|nr:squalene/phytoene synthase family protein [Solirubrobacteraceae bacterium]